MSHAAANQRLQRRYRAGVARPQRQRRRNSEESGFAYLMALFMMLTVMVASTVVLTSAVTEGRRQREEEMVWRGKQYVRAVKLYYRKTGHYPPNLEELQKGMGNVHFLRQAYRDPMNKSQDGKWRFIYTNASGQIIGSVKYATMQQMAILDLLGGSIPAPGSDSAASQESNVTPVPQPGEDTSSSNGNCPPANANPGTGSPGLGSPGIGNPGIGNSGFGNSGFGNSGQGSSGIGPTTGFNANQPPSSPGACPPVPGQGVLQGFQQGNGLLGLALQGGIGQPGSAQNQALQALAQLKPTGPVDSPVIGGFLVGVGSTVDTKSLRVYHHGKKYSEWEFIWNPLEDQALAMQQDVNQAGGGLPGQPNGLGSQQPGLQPGATGSTAAPPGANPVQAPPTEPQPPQIPQQPQ